MIADKCNGNYKLKSITDSKTVWMFELSANYINLYLSHIFF